VAALTVFEYEVSGLGGGVEGGVHEADRAEQFRAGLERGGVRGVGPDAVGECGERVVPESGLDEGGRFGFRRGGVEALFEGGIGLDAFDEAAGHEVGGSILGVGHQGDHPLVFDAWGQSDVCLGEVEAVDAGCGGGEGRGGEDGFRHPILEDGDFQVGFGRGGLEPVEGGLGLDGFPDRFRCEHVEGDGFSAGTARASGEADGRGGFGDGAEPGGGGPVGGRDGGGGDGGLPGRGLRRGAPGRGCGLGGGVGGGGESALSGGESRGGCEEQAGQENRAERGAAGVVEGSHTAGSDAGRGSLMTE
jgi:hypothetical protein